MAVCSLPAIWFGAAPPPRNICGSSVLIKKAKKSYSYSSHHQFLLSLKLEEIAKIKKQESELILQLSQDWPTPRYTELLRRQNNMENFIELYNSVISQPGNNVLVKYNLCTYKELNSDESFDTTFDDNLDDPFCSCSTLD